MDPPDHASRFWAARLVESTTGAVRAQQEGNNGTDAATQIDMFTTPAMNHSEQFLGDAGVAAANTDAATQINTFTTAMNLDMFTTPAMNHFAEQFLEDAGDAAANTDAANQIDTAAVVTTTAFNPFLEKFEDAGDAAANTVDAVAGSIEKFKSNDPAQIVIGVLDILSKSATLVHTNRKHKKESDCDFNPMLLISTIKGAHTGPIWCSSFSADGKYFATGGKDGVVKIWEVSPQLKKGARGSKESSFFDKTGSYWKGSASGSAVKEEVQEEVQDDEQSEDEVSDALGMEIIILNPKPLQTFQDHSKDVIDLSWSNTGYLVSGSLDKTARLWHPSRAMCLSIFTHPDAVVSVSFNPVEDRYFITGGFDKKLRIWNIPNGRVAKYLPTPGIITRVLYGPDGKTAAAGLIDGKVFFYKVTESADVNRVSLRYHTQITTKQKWKKGKKVTGLAFLKHLSDDKIADVSDSINSPRNSKDRGRISGLARKITSPIKRKKKVQQQLLITTNDSRLRLIGMSDFCMVRKYKGHQNTSLQIRARFSESGEFIISGSESKGACTIWNTATKRNPLNLNVTGLHMHDKVKAHEWFEAATGDTPIVTDASFVPRKCLKESILSSGLFPTMISLDNINHDFSSAAIVACDYQGTMRIFLRRTCIEEVSYAAGPAGHNISV